MLDKLKAVESRFEELCFKSELPDFYADPKKAAKLLREKDLKVVLVTNGCANEEIAEKLLPWVDALNIDLKCFRTETYAKTLGGDLETVKRFIVRAAENCHV